ncbi:hypothetical protein GCM10008171_19160 [Methylopila jiangsuensis]|uniref:Uncharacterized protein n=1 Tax=Methylopila jiangsuensis TaxID=586230 RepID=A0A9W6N419_9HYPH|nr:hypothetical protein GCM10008171_19160 [Methylopila jiangsuensis]
MSDRDGADLRQPLTIPQGNQPGFKNTHVTPPTTRITLWQHRWIIQNLCDAAVISQIRISAWTPPVT